MASRKEYEMLFRLGAEMSSSYNSAFKGAQTAISSMQKEITSLNKIQSDISAYQKQQNALESSKAKYENLQKQMELLNQEMTQEGANTTTLEREKLKLQERIDNTADAIERYETQLGKTSQRLEEADVDTANLDTESAQLTKRIEALKKGQDEAANSSAKYGEKMSDAINAAASALSASGIMEYLSELKEAYEVCVSAAGDYEYAMSGVEALSGATAEELTELSNKAKEMGSTTKFTAEEAANAYQYMALAGWDTAQMLDGIEPILKLATAADMGLATASDIVTDYLTAFGLTAKDSANFVDILAYAMANSNTNVTQLGEAYKSCAATSNSLGYSVEETTAVLMTMANAGVKGSEAGTALNAIMTRLATNTKDCADALSDYGVEVYDADGNMNSLSNILNGLAGVWSDLTDQEQANLAKTIAGTNQYSKLQTIMAGCSETAAEGGQSFNDYSAALQNCSGTATTMANTMLDNMNGALTRQQSALDGLKIAVGEKFTPAMTDVYDAEANVLSLLTEFVDDNPALVKAVGAGTTAFAGMATAITAVTAASKLMAAANIGTLITSPIGIAVGAVTALTAGVVLLTETLDDGVPSVKEMTEAAQEMDDALSEANTTFAETADSAVATANVVDGYIDRLEALQQAGLETAESQQEYHNILALVVQMMPDLVDSIDLTNDSIDGGTEALRANTEAWKENAQKQAYQEYINSLAEDYNSVMQEQATNQIKLQQAQNKLDAATQKHNDAQARSNELYQEAQKKVVEYYQATGTLRDVSFYLTEEYEEQQKALSESATEMRTAEHEVKNYTAAIEADAAAVTNAGEALTSAQTAYDQLTASAQNYSNAESVTAAQVAQVEDALANVNQEIADLTENYQNAYDEAYESVSGQYEIWDTAAAIVSTSASTINKALESQIKYWQDYNENLSDLGERAKNIDGLNEMIASFADGSADSVNAIAGMAKASDADLQKMVDNWQTLQNTQSNVSESMADLTTCMSNAMDDIVNEVADAVADMDMSNAAMTSAQATIQGFVDGAESMMPRVEAAYSKIGAAAAQALVTANRNTNIESNNVSVPGYAVGTTSAAPGFAVVGEDGPELVYFAGGEQVVTATETRAMQRAMSFDAVEAETSQYTYGDKKIELSIAPVYQISGTDNGNLSDVLNQQNRDLKDLILSVIEEAEEDQRRGVYA